MEQRVQSPWWKPYPPTSRTQKIRSKQPPLQRARSFITAPDSFGLTGRDLIRMSSRCLGDSFASCSWEAEDSIKSFALSARHVVSRLVAWPTTAGIRSSSDSFQGRNPRKQGATHGLTRTDVGVPSGIHQPSKSDWTHPRGGPECVLIRYEAFSSLIRAMILNNHLVPGNAKWLIS